MTSNKSFCIGTLLQPINSVECLISRILGSIIILVSVLAILFNIRFLHWSAFHGRSGSRDNVFISSIIFSSLSVIVVMLPSVLLQCLTCHRLCSPLYCQLEGFVSYLNGCVHMFLLMMISVMHYVTIICASTSRSHFHRHPHVSVLVCWLLGVAFALPPLFKWNRYIPEGLGFHCGLDWVDRSVSSHIYLLSAILFVYFVPFIVLSFVNLYVYHRIRRLLHKAVAVNPRAMLRSASVRLISERRQSLFYISLKSSSAQSLKFKTIHSNRPLGSQNRLAARRDNDSIQVRHLMHLSRLKVDRRFALATLFLVTEYLLSWTPYAIVALLNLFRIEFIAQQPLVITFCAFIAKISMIINPFIYISAIKTTQLRTILYRQECVCYRCRVRKTVF